MLFSKPLKADSIQPNRDILEYKNHKFYENNEYIPKRDLIFHASCSEGTYLRSKRTGAKYTRTYFKKKYGYFPYSF